MFRNAFACDEFLAFSAGSVSNAVGRGVLKDADGDHFPYFIINKKHRILGEKRNFLISPICFSGKDNLKINELVKQLDFELKSYNLAGGFLQTRDFRRIEPKAYLTEWGGYYIDERTNYRLPLGLSDDQLLSRMKRDSRSRVRKLIEKRGQFEIQRGHSNEVRLFSEIYAETAKRIPFSDNYHFRLDQWRILLSNPNWELYWLVHKNRKVAGTIVSRVTGGFDYTFMAYIDGLKDLGRANIFYLYKHLERSGAYLDLGGGIIEGDALARFKLGMGGEPKPFKRVRFIFSGKELQVREEHLKYLKNRWP